MTTSLDILIRARDAASSTIRGVGTEAQRLDASMGSAVGKTSRLGGLLSSTAGKFAALAGGAFAVKKAFDFGADLVHSAEEAQAAARAAFGAIRADADKSALSTDRLAASAETFGDSIGQDDEAVLGLSARLAQMVDLTKMFGAGGAQAGLETMTRSVYDMSAATGKSTSMITRLFASITNDPGAAVGTLQKLGVITERQADHFKAMADNGKDAAVSQQLLGLVSQKYQGQAARGATASAKLGAIWNNLKETLGGFLIPALETVTGWLGSAASAFQGLLENGLPANKWLDSISQAFKALWDIVKQVAAAFMKSLWPSLKQAWEAVKQLFNAVKPVLKVLLLVQGAVLMLALKALPIVVKALGVVISIAAKVVTAFADVVSFVRDKFVAPLATAIGHVITWLARVYDWVKDKLVGAWDALKSGAIAVINVIISGLNLLIAAINRVQDGLDVIAGPTVNFEHIKPIPALASGGIVTKPTLALIGEAGPEAVVPLGKRAPYSAGGLSVGVTIDRRRWVRESDYEVAYGGV